jgi:aryl-alcohol dehydrogenase-like predicted oxidoreductase
LTRLLDTRIVQCLQLWLTCAAAAVLYRFVLSHPLVASAVIGATSVQQLQEQVEAARQGTLSEEVMQQVDAIHQQYPSPTP